MSKIVLFAVLTLIPTATCEVFFSCKGDDTRSSFADHLYTALRQARIHTLREEDGIPIGENIGLAIKRAIYESKVSVIVLSKDHATSENCLNELLIIMDRRMTDPGYLVVPVFYHVHPSNVAEQTGKYGEAFAQHEKRFRETMDVVEKWRQALKEVGNFQGIIILNNSYESQSIQRIVQEIGNKLNHNLPSIQSFTSLIEFLVSIAVIILGTFFIRGEI